MLISAFGTRRIVAGVALTLLLLAVAARPPWLGARVYELGSLALVILVAGSVGAQPVPARERLLLHRVVNVNVDVPAGTGETDAAATTALSTSTGSSTASSTSAIRRCSTTRTSSCTREAIAKLHPPAAASTRCSSAAARTRSRATSRRRYRGRIVVAEIDPAVTKIAREKLGLATSSRMEIHHEDARRVLRSLPADEQFDLVFGDAFNDFRCRTT